MKHYLMHIFSLVTLITPCPAPAEDGLPEIPQGKKWIKIELLSDEFNGDRLDAEKWVPKHPYWTGRDSTHTESNVSIGDGNLRLMSTLRPGATEVTAQTVTAACVASSTPRCRYGYYEARIKSSHLSMTSAFWFQGKYSEIDVVENIGNASEPNSAWVNETMMMNTHYFKGGWKNDRATPANWKMPAGSSARFHTYGVWWKDATTIWFYHDGVRVAQVDCRGPFDEPQYMFFDTEVFTWYGWPTRESLLDPTKNTMLVDWVRAWQLTDDVTTSP